MKLEIVKNMIIEEHKNFIQQKDGLISNGILDTTDICIFWKDKERRFVGVNRAFLEFYGFASQEELIGKTDEDMGWHSDPDPFKNDEWRVLKEGISTYHVHGKCMVRGEEHDILASKSPLYEADGSIVGLVGHFEDVTKDYQQKDEIRKLNETLSHIPSGICIAQIHFQRVIIKSINEYLLHMMGESAQQFVEEDIAELSRLLMKDEVEGWKQKANEIYSNASAFDGLYRFKKPKRDKYQWLRIVGVKARLENDEEYLYFTFTNEDELKFSENREKVLRTMYASSVDAASLVVWEFDVKTRSIHFAKSAYTVQRCKELGLTSVMHNVPDCFYPGMDEENKQKIKQFHDDAIAGKPFSAIDVIYQLEGQNYPLYLHLTYTAAFDETGKTVKAYGTANDYSQQKAMEKDYERELLSINYNQDPNMFAKGHHDLTDNKVLDYYKSNNTVMDVSHMTYDQAYHSLINYIYGDEKKQEYLAMYDRQNLIANFHAGQNFFQMEYRRDHKDNSAMWVNMEIHTFQNPSNGHIECFIYSRDITDSHIRQQMINNLKRIGYEKIALISCLDQRLGIYSPSEKRDSWVKTMDVDNYDAYARSIICSNLLQLDQLETTTSTSLQTVIEKLETKDLYGLSVNQRDENGELHRKYLSYSYLDQDRSVISVTVQDITEQYQKEQEQVHQLLEAKKKGDEANIAKSNFLSRMSHDIRTPLNGIIGMTYLAKKETDPKKCQDYLNKIDTSSKFLLGLVIDILDMTKIESNKIVLHPEPYASNIFINYIEAVIRPLCTEKGQKLIMDLPTRDDVVPVIDILRINQIFFNLFSNAVKYTPEGGTITCRLRESLQEDHKLMMEVDVIDTGIGMDAKLQKTLFDPFVQGERSDTASNRGTGLGLAIVKSLTELMGGTISVTSELGKGSDFHFHVIFDYIDASKIKQKKKKTDEDAAEADLSGKHILLCEDHPLNQEITKTLLESRGAIVEIAGDGDQGVRLFKDSAIGTFDLILMDIRMPVKDGYQATKEIRALPRIDAKHLPIVAITTDAFGEDVEKCLAAGMNGHLSKPIDPDKMYHLLGTYLAK